MIIDILPIWMFFLLTVGLVLICVEVGFRVAKVFRETDKDGDSTDSQISGVILGLVAFMLAFTFGSVFERYDSKKALVREEAGAIRTAFYRADFLLEPDRSRTKETLLRYLEDRITIAEHGDPRSATESLQNFRAAQQQIWDIAVANGRLNMDSDVGALFVESVNEIANVHALRVDLGLQVRIPTAMWVVLTSLLILGTLSVGYDASVKAAPRVRLSVALAVSFALVFALIAALDHPGDKWMPVTQQPLKNVLNQIKAE